MVSFMYKACAIQFFSGSQISPFSLSHAVPDVSVSAAELMDTTEALIDVLGLLAVYFLPLPTAVLNE